MSDVIHTVCCVAELELRDDNYCPECNNNLLELHEYIEETRTFFDADVFVAGGNLQSYQFDKGEIHSAPGKYSPDLKVRIDYPPEQPFSHLCLRYNREGGARINVVAVNVGTGAKIRPSNIPADGTDKACPIESASIDDEDFPVAQFQWDEGKMTVILDQHRGAWTISPSELGLIGNMVLTARQQLAPGDAMPPVEPGMLPGKFEFVRWERNRLSNWVQGQDHQWSGDGDTIEFDNNTYTGVIAYYEYKAPSVGDYQVNWPYTKPGPETPGDPAPKVVWPILSALLRVWSRVVAFVKRVFRR